MSRGLDMIFAKLQKDADPILLERYLSLVADLKDPQERAQRSLAVAQLFLAAKDKSHKKESFIFSRSGEEGLQDSDSYLDSMSENDSEEKNASLVHEPWRKKNRKTHISQGGLQRREQSAKKRNIEKTRSDLDESSKSPRESREEDSPFRHGHSEESYPSLMAGKLFESNDDSLSQELSEMSLTEEDLEQTDFHLEISAADSSNSLEQGEPNPLDQPFSLRGSENVLHLDQEIPEKSLDLFFGGLSDKKDLAYDFAQRFDDFRDSGMLLEAKKVLEQSQSFAHEAWWQKRYRDLQALEELKIELAKDKTARNESTLDLWSSQSAEKQGKKDSKDPTQDIEDLLESVYFELQKIHRRMRIPFASSARAERIRSILSDQNVSPDWILMVSSIDTRHLNDHVKELLWELVQKFWPGGADENCFQFLKCLNLFQLEPKWFSYYLNAMIITGRSAQVSAFVLRFLLQGDLTSRISWAKIAVPYWEMAAKNLGLIIPSWHEDEGIESLVNKLSMRPRLSMKALVAG